MTIFTKSKKTWLSSAHQGFVKENIHSNTLAAYLLAAQKGADMIETDARTTRDGVLIANHDETVKGYDAEGNFQEYRIPDTDFEEIAKLTLMPNGGRENRVPTLRETLHLAYFTGMGINIDLKEGMGSAEKVAHLVVEMGMQGRTVYATNGAGAPAIRKILEIDPEALFIDTKANYTREKLMEIPDYPAKCFVYTSDFSDENIAQIRQSGCMLATISLNANNAAAAFRHHPKMAEYPHTSDFEAIDRDVLEHITLI